MDFLSTTHPGTTQTQSLHTSPSALSLAEEHSYVHVHVVRSSLNGQLHALSVPYVAKRHQPPANPFAAWVSPHLRWHRATTFETPLLGGRSEAHERWRN